MAPGLGPGIEPSLPGAASAGASHGSGPGTAARDSTGPAAADLGLGASGAGPSTASPPVAELGTLVKTIVVPAHVGLLLGALDPAAGTLFVSEESTAYVAVVSTSTNALVATVPVGSSPTGVAYVPTTGEVYVANYNSGNLTVIAGQNDTVVGDVPVGGGAEFVTYDSANGYLYVACRLSGNVTVVRASDNTVVGNISLPAGAQPIGIAYDPTNGLVYAVDTTNVALDVLNGTSLDLTLSLGSSPEPRGDAYDPANGLLYVATSTGLSIVHPGNGSVDELSLGFEAYQPVYDPANGEVYVDNALGSDVVAVQAASGEVVGNLSLGALAGDEPQGLVYDAANADLYAFDHASSNISVVSTALAIGPVAPALRGTGVTGISAGSAPAGPEPTNVTYDPADGDLFVGHSTGDVVGVVNASTLAPVANVTVGRDPFDLAYDPSNGEIYVANFGGPNVTVLDGATLRVVANIPLPSDAESVVYDSGDGEVYVADDLSVAAIDPATNSVVATIPAPCPFVLSYDPAADVVVVGDGCNGDLTFVASGSHDLLARTIALGNTLTYAFAYDPGNGELFAVNSAPVYPDGTNNVTVLSWNLTVVGNFALTDQSVADGIVFSPTNGLLYVSEAAENSVVALNLTGGVVGSFGMTSPAGLGYDNATGEVAVASQGASSELGEIATLLNPSVPTTPSLDVGQTLVLSAPVLSPGTGDLSVSVSATGAGVVACTPDERAGPAVSVACSGLAAGSSTVTVVVIDSLGSSASTAIDVTVEPELGAPVVGAGPASMDLGQETDFYASVAGGSGGTTYAWTGLPPGCAGATDVFSCVPTAAGTSSVFVTMTDSDGASVTGGPLTVTVFEDPAAVVTASSGTVVLGQSLTLSAEVTGGAGGLSYRWTGLPSGCQATVSTFTCQPNRTGTYSISVTVTDANGGRSTSEAVAVVVEQVVEPTPTSSATPLPPADTYAAIGLGVLGAALGAAALALGRRGPRSPAPAPPSGPSGGPPGTGVG